MKKTYENVYQFKITLLGIKPQIWRRILVPENYTFHQLSKAILRAMGWSGGHLHSFYLKDPVTGENVEIANLEFAEPMSGVEVLDEKKQKIARFFNEKSKALYLYDFGDNWEHDVVLEKILPREPDRKYPVCIDGKRACPPDDVGGFPGYERFLEAIMGPEHPEHDDSLEWVGGEFDPEYFDPKSVKFR